LLVSSAQICIANSPEVPLTASPPVSGMLKPIVIGCPDGPSARLTAEAADITAAAATITLVNRRNMFLPFPLSFDSASL